MADIELVDQNNENVPENVPEADGDTETDFGGRDPNESIAIMSGDPVVEEEEDEETLDEQVEGNSFFRRMGVYSRRAAEKETRERKEVLSELGVRINQVDGDEFPNSRFILNNSEVIRSKKSGKPIGIKFDGVRVTAFVKGKIKLSKDQKVKTSKNAFEELVKKSQQRTTKDTQCYD